jgi:sugar/nucleoside kinase (ribokinase family)
MSELVAIGHVARDEFPSGDWRCGGSAFYGAATIARLGASVALVTRVADRERPRFAEECARLRVEFHPLPSERTTTFAFRARNGHRELRLLARAAPIGATDVPARGRGRATLLGSVIGEHTDGLFGSATRPVLAAQGEIRTVGPDRVVRRAPWARAETVLPTLRAAVLSEEDLEGDLAFAIDWSRQAPVVVTRGEHGCALFRNGTRLDMPAYRPDGVVDPTGAGDAFAAGLLVALEEDATWEEACDFANCVASFCLEGVGIGGLAERSRVEHRRRRGERLPT